MRIGVIADTHRLLRPEALARLAGVAHILHAGDIGGPDIVPRLREIAPVTAIRVNVDREGWAEAFPETTEVTLAGRSVYLLHDIKALDRDPVEHGHALVVSGHSHRPSVETADGVLYLNPGSAGRRRFRLPVSLATLEIGADGIAARVHELAV